MSQTREWSQAYRERLRKGGRRQILLALDEQLIRKIDETAKSEGVPRASVVARVLCGQKEPFQPTD